MAPSSTTCRERETVIGFAASVFLTEGEATTMEEPSSARARASMLKTGLASRNRAKQRCIYRMPYIRMRVAVERVDEEQVCSHADGLDNFIRRAECLKRHSLQLLF